MLADDWQSRLSASASRIGWPARVFVLESCESTQDQAAAFFAEHNSELAVFTLHQSKGRGRLGRTWEHQPAPTTSPLGIAVTFALPSHRHDATWLPIRAAVAAKAACDDVAMTATNDSDSQILLKWPNDLVTRTGHKLAGILVEKPGSLDALLLGIGINVSHKTSDFPAGLPATSLSLLSNRSVSILDVADNLIRHLSTWLTAETADVEQAWKASDALTGTVQTLQHDNHTYTGTILDISPTRHLKIQTNTGITTLPAATTTLVK